MIEPQPRPDWSPLPRAGCVEVEGRVLLGNRRTIVATLRFAQHATIDEHSAPYEIDVACLDGSGFVSVGDETAEIRAGQTVSWPAGVDHRLWTEGSTMETLMVEHLR